VIFDLFLAVINFILIIFIIIRVLFAINVSRLVDILIFWFVVVRIRVIVLFTYNLLSILEGNANLNIVFALLIVWCHIVNHIVLVHEKVAEVPCLLIGVHRSEHSDVTIVASSITKVLCRNQHVFSIDFIVDTLACIEETDFHANLVLPGIF